MIILQPVGGLCNRMRTIASALQLAKRKNTNLLVFWQCNGDLNAPFESLFEPIKGMKVINYNSSKDVRRIFLRRISRTRISDEDITNNKVNGELTESFCESLKLPVYIKTYVQFYNVENSFKIFEPSTAIASKIKSLTADFSKNMVGVHIRRTDQKKSIEYSKTENFIDLMKREIEINPSVCFYLATDDMKEEELLRREFPGRILSNSNRMLQRNSQEGMNDAVIDLYCLSYCKKIIGSYWSSFSEIAAALYSARLLIAGIDLVD